MLASRLTNTSLLAGWQRKSASPKMTYCGSGKPIKIQKNYMITEAVKKHIEYIMKETLCVEFVIIEEAGATVYVDDSWKDDLRESRC